MMFLLLQAMFSHFSVGFTDTVSSKLKGSQKVMCVFLSPCKLL